MSADRTVPLEDWLGLILSHLNTLWERFATPPLRVGVALSGGVDSVVLLRLMLQCQQILKSQSRFFELLAVHINFKLSAEDDAWQHFCESLCAELGIALQIECPKNLSFKRKGIEAAAREARLKILAQQPVEGMFLGHHRDDQIETFFLQALRGTGLAGLAGMPSCALLPGSDRVWMFRPFLALSKQAIIQFAQQSQWSWSEDSSNQQNAYRRNFLRLDILPNLFQRFQGSEAALVRTMAHIHEAVDLLEEVAQQDLTAIQLSQRCLNAKRLQALSPRRRKQVIWLYLRQQGCQVNSAGQLNSFLTQLSLSKENTVRWKLGQVDLVAQGDYIWLVSRCQLLQPCPRIDYQGETILDWPPLLLRLRFSICQDGQGICMKKLNQQLFFIATRGKTAVRFRPYAGRPSWSLKALFVHAGISAWIRDYFPVIWLGDQVIALPSIAVDERWKAALGQPGLKVELESHGSSVWLPIGQRVL